MQTVERQVLESKLEKIGNVLRLAGWIGLCTQIGFGAIALLLVVFAIAGRNFSQATALPPGAAVGIGVALNRGATPGISIGIFWAVCDIMALLVGIYFAFRQTRFAKRLRHADTMKHPTKSEVMNLLRLSAIVGLVGMLLTILGGARR
jgi:vacuolar-type H+-ATPase subunit I/STV1